MRRLLLITVIIALVGCVTTSYSHETEQQVSKAPTKYKDTFREKILGTLLIDGLMK
ncbi:hypothetical protein JCM19231_1118 [Vibrio ishigakensis]|uniref:Uncharacterized protein n=1 Tax=Vibrio ishigakensis TaxID=1481914 RepID=A0A0B8NSF8_9VIBR|nr:hypothetical protein JCM19231_1118 [Vibrio ishigakensis]